MLNADCIHFRGDKPCQFKVVCEGCLQYEPFSTRILIIKCRAQGDVLRTTPLLPGLKRRYPKSFISWLVDGDSVDLLRYNPQIDRILSFDLESALSLSAQRFDVLISLDKEPGLASTAAKVAAAKKFGFGLNEYGNLVIFNPAAEYAYRLGMDDPLKFRQNRKTYQEIIHEAAEIPYRRDEYIFVLTEEDRERARRFFKQHRVSGQKPAVGLNTGAGNKFETKQWPEAYYLRLIDLVHDRLEANVFLLGGPRELELNRRLEKKSKGKAINTGHDNSLREFAGFLSLMDAVVCSDTLGMHLAIALKRNVIALFGPTCPQEIDLYGRGVKLFAGIDCSPCYKQTCPDMACMKDITVEQVFKEIKKLI